MYAIRRNELLERRKGPALARSDNWLCSTYTGVDAYTQRETRQVYSLDVYDDRHTRPILGGRGSATSL